MIYVLVFLGWQLWESLPHPCGPFLVAGEGPSVSDLCGCSGAGAAQENGK